MLNLMRELAEFLNISGSEDDLSNHLKTKFSLSFTVFSDFMGNIIVRKKGKGVLPKKILVSVPLDVPGFLCLHAEKGKGYLAPTGTLSLESISGESLYNSFSKIFSLFSSKEKDCYYVKGSTHLGEAFRLKPDFSEKDGLVFGRFAARYALMTLLCQLIEKDFYNDLFFAFTTGFETRARSEVNLIKREKPDLVVLLGRIEDQGSTPVVMVKDGKALAHTDLVEKAVAIGKNEKIHILPMVSEKCVTKAESVISYTNIPIISFALPALFPDKKNEAISKCSYQNLEILLTKFLNEKF